MKKSTFGLTSLHCILFFSTVALLYSSSQYGANAATTLKIRRNFTIVVVRSRGSLTPQASIGIPRRLPSPWKGKLGPPRIRTTTKPPSENITTTTTQPPVFSYNTSIPDEDVLRRVESVNVISSDVPSSAVVWPHRSRSGSKRFRLPTPTTPEPQLLLKLLQPKPTRPAIYSLDGFVPKPSIQRPVSTEAPPLLFKKDLQQLGSSPRRRKVNRYSKEDEEEDELQYLGGRRKKKPVSRYTAFARKGVPGEDFPVFTVIPQTDFDCGPQPGLYADPYTDCQVWHMCPGGNLSPRHSFLCPNGTIFNQKKRICDWWYNVDCRKHTRRIRSSGQQLFEINITGNQLF